MVWNCLPQWPLVLSLDVRSKITFHYKASHLPIVARAYAIVSPCGHACLSPAECQPFTTDYTFTCSKRIIFYTFTCATFASLRLYINPINFILFYYLLFYSLLESMYPTVHNCILIAILWVLPCLASSEINSPWMLVLHKRGRVFTSNITMGVPGLPLTVDKSKYYGRTNEPLMLNPCTSGA